MTVQTAFWNWQDNPRQPDPGRCAPLPGSWLSYLLDRWGGQNLGCYSPRPVVGGSSPSTHGSGAALDWRYQDPGCGRRRMLDEVLPFLIDNSLELGVQAVHDYVGCRIWRPPGTSGRPSQSSPDCGWRAQTPGSQMGQSWALWLHIEVLNTRWSDTRSVDELLGDDMPSAQEVAQAVWDLVLNQDATGQQPTPAWRYIRNLSYYELEPNGYTTESDGIEAVFWNGIRDCVRGEVEAVLRDAGVIR